MPSVNSPSALLANLAFYHSLSLPGLSTKWCGKSSHEVPPLPLAQKFLVLPHSIGQSRCKSLYIFLLYTSPSPTLLHPHTPSVHPSWTHHIFLSHRCLLFTLIVLPETPWNALYLCLSYPWFKAVFSFINLFLISKPCFLPCWKLIALSYWKKHTLHLL